MIFSFYKNRRGASVLAILLLVFMTLVLVISAAYSFIVSSRADTRITDSRFIEIAYAKEFELSNQIFVLASSNVVEKYADLSNDFMKKSDKDLIIDDFDVFFQGGKLKIKNKFIDGGYSFYYDLTEENKKFLRIYENTNFLQKSFVEEDELPQYLSMVYYPNVKVKLLFDEIGLHSFDLVKISIKECSLDSILDKKQCLSDKLFNFDISVSDEKITLSSKKYFYLNGAFKKIVLGVDSSFN